MNPATEHHRGIALRVILLLGLVIAAVGSVRLVAVPRLPDVGVVPGSSAVSPAPARPLVERTGADPTWLSLPAERIQARVVGVDVAPDGELAVPDDPRELGWWRGGARPGAARGSVVIDGHVDTRAAGAGALFGLSRLTPGATLSLATAAGRHDYVVRAVRAYPKTALPAEVFDISGPPRLVLITCGGPFDSRTRQYADNIVAYAVPVAP